MGLGSVRFRFSIEILKKSTETPKQKPQANKPYGIQEVLNASRFLRRIRFGWNADRIWASTPQNRTYRARGLNRLFSKIDACGVHTSERIKTRNAPEMNMPSSKTSNSRSKVAVLNVSLKVILSSNFGIASLATGF